MPRRYGASDTQGGASGGPVQARWHCNLSTIKPDRCNRPDTGTPQNCNTGSLRCVPDSGPRDSRVTKRFKCLPATLGALMLVTSPAYATADERGGLPPPPPGVTDLRFEEFLRLPVGRAGLEPTEQLLALSGKRVRVLGYVASEEAPTPGLFMLAALPVTLAEVADGPADDLPPATLYVHMAPVDADKVVSHQPGLLVVSGTLEVGNQNEANGRVSFVRLQLDQPLTGARTAAAATRAGHGH